MLSRILTFYLVVTPFSAHSFQEYEVEQDRFAWERVAPNVVRLCCWFSREPRPLVAPLVFASPNDATIEWTLVSAQATVNRQSVRLAAEDAGELSTWVRGARQWLSDIPLMVYRFGPVDRFPALGPDRSSPIQAIISDATFELRFSRPVPELSDNQGNRSRIHDAFLELASFLAVNPDEIPAVRGLSTESLITEPSEKELPAYLSVDRCSNGLDCLRITTREPGPLVLSGQAAAEAGFNISAHPIEHLTLYHHGRPYPLSTSEVSGANWSRDDSIWFLALSINSSETWENVYYLGWDDQPGDRMEDLGDFDQGSGKRVRDWDYAEITLEENDPSLQAHGPTPGIFDVGWKRFDSPQDSLEVVFDLPGGVKNPDGAAPPSLQIQFLQVGEGLPSPALEAEANGRRFPVEVLSASQSQTVFDPGFLRPRGNRLSLRGGEASPAILDRLIIRYPTREPLSRPILRSLPPESSEIAETTSSTLVRRTLSDASGDWRTVQIEEGIPKAFYRHRITGGTPSLLTELAAASFEFFLVDLNRPIHPSSICKVDRPSIRENLVQADLVVIAPDVFLPQLRDYLNIREKQGWSTQLLSIQQVYDEFSFGVKDRRAIRDFCRFALHRYPEPKPQFLWLVGEASWDPKQLLGPGTEDMVPTPPKATEGEGLSGDDQEYVKVVGEDELPDLLVARVSVSTTQELSNYLEKAKASEGRPELGWWRATSLLLSDQGFRRHHHEHLDWGLIQRTYPRMFSVSDYPWDRIRAFEAVGREGMEARGIRQAIVSAWSEGATFLEYVGHGGVTVWSTNSLFKGLDRPDSDALRLTNRDRYPLMLIRSCLSGGVNWPVFPGTVSVAEEALRVPERGAVAAIGAAGMTYQNAQEKYARFVHGALWNRGLRRLGSVRGYAHAKHVLANPLDIEIAGQFHLHGDPLLELNFPKEGEIESATWERDDNLATLSLTWEQPLAKGTGQFRLHWDGEILFESSPFPLTRGTDSGRWQVPLPTAVRDNLTAAVYFWDEESGEDAFAAAKIPAFVLPTVEETRLISSVEGSPFEVRWTAMDPPLVKGCNEPFAFQVNLLDPARGGAVLEARVLIDDRLQYETILRIEAGGSVHNRVEIPFAKAGAHFLRIELESDGLVGKSRTESIVGELTALEPGRLELGNIHIDPPDPVSGETPFIALSFENSGAAPIRISETVCEVELSAGTRIPIYPLERDRDRFPLSLLPGGQVEIVWSAPPDLPVGGHSAEIRIETEEGSVRKRHPFYVGRPPEIEILSIEAFSTEGDSTPIGEPVHFRIDYRNRGDAPSDELVLSAADRLSADTLSVPLPLLPARGAGRVETAIASQGSDFWWDVRLSLTPTAIASRTKWNPQKLDSHLTRSWDLTRELAEGVFTKVVNRAEDLGPISHQLLEPANLGFVASKDAQKRTLLSGDLDILETGQVRSAVDPYYASTLFRIGWWVGASEIHANAEWDAPNLKLRIPWRGAPVLARLAPTYRKVGRDMPNFALEGPHFRDTITVENSSFEGVHPEKKVVALHPPGIPFELKKLPGRLTGFMGFELVPLPSVQTPILEFPDAGPWTLQLDLEVPAEPREMSRSEIRIFEEGIGWSEWAAHFPEPPVRSTKAQLRGWMDPTLDPNPAYLRSLALSIRRAVIE